MRATGRSFSLLVSDTKYKRPKASPSPRLHQTASKDAIVTYEPTRLHQTTAMVASHGSASSGVGGTPFGAITSAFMHGMTQMQPGLQTGMGGKMVNAGTPNGDMQVFNRKQSQASSSRIPAVTDQDDPLHAPKNKDAIDDFAKLESDMTASKKAVDAMYDAELKEKKAAAAEKKASEAAKKAAAPSVSDPVCKRPAAAPAVAPPVLRRPAAVKRPAAAMLDDIDAVASAILKLDEVQAEPRRRYYISRVHHKAYRAAINRGMSKDEACTVRSEMFRRAAVLHDEVHRG